MNYLYTKPFIPPGEKTPVIFDPAKYFYFSGNLRLRSEYKLSIQSEIKNNKTIRKYGVVSLNNNYKQSAVILSTFEPSDSWKVDNKNLSDNELEDILTKVLGMSGCTSSNESNNGEANNNIKSGTLEELRAGVSTTSVLWSPLVLSTWLKETINHQEEDPLKIYQEELLKK